MDLYVVFSIIDRNKAEKMIKLHEELSINLLLSNLGEGTATSAHLLLYDLEQCEKTVITAIVSTASLHKLIRAAKRKLFIDIPGNGVMMAIPLKSIAGGKNLAYITEGQTLGGEMPSMHFEHELIVVILNEGYTDFVMDAARSAGATGGTVFHAKGTGKEKAEKFYGFSLAEEKDMIYILAHADKKAAIMKEITTRCGIGTKSAAICFSLPVSEVAGIRKFDEE